MSQIGLVLAQKQIPTMSACRISDPDSLSDERFIMAFQEAINNARNLGKSQMLISCANRSIGKISQELTLESGILKVLNTFKLDSEVWLVDVNAIENQYLLFAVDITRSVSEEKPTTSRPRTIAKLR